MGKRDYTRVRERDSRKLQIIRQHASSVSRAIWPANIRQSYAVEKFAPRKKSSPFIKTWRHLREYCAYLCFRLLSLFTRLSSGFVGRNLHSNKKLQTRDVAALTGKTSPHTRSASRHTPPLPETPMPSEPRVRVLETYDLSHSDIEHFLNGDESHLATIHSDRKKAVARNP